MVQVVKGVEELHEVDSRVLGCNNNSGCVPTDPIDIFFPFKEQNQG